MFSLADLPDDFIYFETKITIKTSSLSIIENSLNMRFECYNTIIEHRIRNSGDETIFSLLEIEAVLETSEGESKPICEVVGYGKNNQGDLMSVLLRKDRNQTFFSGRISRSYVDYS